MKKRLLIFFLILLTPSIIKASSVAIYCDSEVIKNDSFSCSIKGNSTNIVIGLSMKIKTGNNITFSSFTRNNKWQGDGEGGKIDLYTSEDLKGNFDIGTITFKVNRNQSGIDSNIGLNEIMFFGEDGTSENINNYSKKIRIASTNNNLSNLSINSGTLNPNFNSNITTYSTTINTSEIIISAQTENNKANITGDIGKKKLSYGNNTFRINVVSESGNIKTYTINIIRPSNADNKETKNEKDETKDNNNNLKEINIEDFNINFNKEVLEYEIEVPYNKEKIKIEATPESTKAKVEILNKDKLEIGNNKIEINVTSEDGNIKTYLLNIIRLEDKSELTKKNIIKDYNDIDKNNKNDILIKTIFIVIYVILLILNILRIIIKRRNNNYE